MAISSLKVALLCGGPSLERGISLNSARSVMDHLDIQGIEIIPIYFDAKKNAYHISRNQLYSNTPSDFDFKLQQTSLPLKERALIALLKKTDIAFLAMHGRFAEDGELQRLLEKHNIPFVGSSRAACKHAFDKYNANEFIKQHGFFSPPSALLKIYHQDHRAIIEDFFKKYKIERAVVKPASGGSSIGVFSVSSPKEALAKVNLLFKKRLDTRVVIEPFAKGIEFTTIILENRFGLPVALPPTEIETDYTEHQIFDFRRKYLPTRQVIWHCPPRFDNQIIEKIQAQAEQIFALFKMRDFGRFDGWVLDDGTIWFCDFNPISGMEQNSFLFQQASRIGMSHANVLQYILKNACRRYGINFLENQCNNNYSEQHQQNKKSKKQVNVLFGGGTSERQVSLMSGTNVWLKLRQSDQYEPHPFLLDMDNNVWRLPYHLALNHTVEEITENCKNHEKAKHRMEDFERRARLKLGLLAKKDTKEFFSPKKITLKDFIKESRFVFNALHGGDGENGTLQKLLEKSNVKFNGANATTSKLCIDKWATSAFISGLKIEGVNAIHGKTIKTSLLFQLLKNKKNNAASLSKSNEINKFWCQIKKELNAKTLIVKPRSDGCSTGIVHLYSPLDLAKYIDLLKRNASFAPKHTFKNQQNIIEMPCSIPDELIFEKFIETDILRVKNHKIKHHKKTGWIEITIGVIEEPNVKNKIKAFNPSITVAEGEVLTVEEKFQGGTGINITPPPPTIMQPKVINKIKKLIELVALRIGIKGYARIDAFANIYSGDLLIIEVNTLPGLTPSTVLYHQALAEKSPISPRSLLERLIMLGGNWTALPRVTSFENLRYL